MATGREEPPPLALAWGALRATLQLHVGTLEAVVDRAGVVYGAIRRASYADGGHDFCMFCTAKIARTVRALTLLQDNLMSEECYPLVRTTYEHYLAMAAVQADLSFLDDFLIKPLGLKVGTLAHPTSKKGIPIFRDVMDVASGQRLGGIRSTPHWAASTGWAGDRELHDLVYGYLSEHIHPNMVASGNYRNETEDRFVYDSKRGILQAAFWCVLASGLFIQALNDLDEAREVAGPLLEEAHEASLMSIGEYLGLSSSGSGFEEFPDLLRRRLAESRRLDPTAWARRERLSAGLDLASMPGQETLDESAGDDAG